jgi:hypothetical protein
MVGFAPRRRVHELPGHEPFQWSRTARPSTRTIDCDSWTLYNFIPGKTYYYKDADRIRARRELLAHVRDPADARRADAAPPDEPRLPEPELRERLASSTRPDTKYVIIETDDLRRRRARRSQGARDYLVAIAIPKRRRSSGTSTSPRCPAVTRSVRVGVPLPTAARRRPSGPPPDRGRPPLLIYEWASTGRVVSVSTTSPPPGECDGGARAPKVRVSTADAFRVGRTERKPYVLASSLSSVIRRTRRGRTPATTTARVHRRRLGRARTTRTR